MSLSESFNDPSSFPAVAFGPGAVPGEESGGSPSAQRPSLLVPAPPGPVLRPPAQDPPPGLEAAEFAHQPGGGAQAGGFRARPGSVGPLPHFLLRGGDALVPSAGSPPRLHPLLFPFGYVLSIKATAGTNELLRMRNFRRFVGRWVHLRGAPDGQPGLPGSEGRGGPAGKDLQSNFSTF